MISLTRITRYLYYSYYKVIFLKHPVYAVQAGRSFTRAARIFDPKALNLASSPRFSPSWPRAVSRVAKIDHPKMRETERKEEEQSLEKEAFSCGVYHSTQLEEYRETPPLRKD